MKGGTPQGTYAIIPARGGSKGFPKKSIAPLGGFPLIAYSIAAAKLSKKIDRIIVSTDSEEMAALAETRRHRQGRRDACRTHTGDLIALRIRNARVAVQIVRDNGRVFCTALSRRRECRAFELAPPIISDRLSA